jgi:small subunit ribosomal protein S16
MGDGFSLRSRRAMCAPFSPCTLLSFFERTFHVLMIRLARVGARKQPHYRIVVIEKDRARNGRSIEVVGTYNPRTSPASLELKRDRIDYWVGNGARLSDRLEKLVAQPAATSPAAAA